jgi:prepilin-type N-terminal cleavage/methylation domain-containing protein
LSAGKQRVPSSKSQVPSWSEGRKRPRVSTWNLESVTWNRRSGFTLIELLVALTILVFAFAIIWQTFSATVMAWQRGGELLDELRHGDFVMEQFVSALRSTAFFPSAPGAYGFHLKNHGSGTGAADILSWVTSSSAFMKPDSPFFNSLHRLVINLEQNKDGEMAVAVRAYPYLTEKEELDADPWFVSTEIKGIDCRVYDFDDETWKSEWEDTNSVPSLVEITLTMDPIEKYGEPLTLKRLVEIPVAPAVTNAVKPDTGGETAGAQATGTSGSSSRVGDVQIKGTGGAQ